MKQTLKIGVMLAVIAALATTGIAVAQSGDDGSVFSTVEETADTEAAAFPTERPMRARILQWLEPLVDEETITQDQAEAVADTLAERMPRLGQGIVRGLHALDEAADFLDMTVRELVEALRDGATLGDLAEEHGLGAEALIDHLVGLVEQHLDEAVADGRLTGEEASDHLARATEHITDLVNGVLDRPLPGMGVGRGMGPGPQGGSGSGPCREGDAAGSGLSELGA